MVRTASTMMELGTQAPDFDLPDATTHRPVTRSEFAGKPLLVVFMCNHCPYVQHLREHLAATAREYEQRGLAVVGINSNDSQAHPEDRPEKMADDAKRFDYPFPYLFDDKQEVAKAYGAACTPDFFLFDRDHTLAYRGQYDDTRPRSGDPPTGADLKAAMDAVLAGEPVSEEQKPSLGCNIKWKPGNEPEYFRG